MITVTTPPATISGSIFRLGIIYLVVPIIVLFGVLVVIGYE